MHNYLFINCDAPRPWEMYFQDSASPQMEALAELHDNIMFYLVIILFGLCFILCLKCFPVKSHSHAIQSVKAVPASKSMEELAKEGLKVESELAKKRKRDRIPANIVYSELPKNPKSKSPEPGRWVVFHDKFDAGGGSLVGLDLERFHDSDTININGFDTYCIVVKYPLEGNIPSPATLKYIPKYGYERCADTYRFISDPNALPINKRAELPDPSKSHGMWLISECKNNTFGNLGKKY